MDVFDELMQQSSGLDLAAIGARVGLTPDQVETAARSLLPQITDPAVDNREALDAVASGTGIAQPVLEALVPALLQQARMAGASGGAFQAVMEGLRSSSGWQPGLDALAGALDRDADGNPFDDMLGMLSGGRTR